MTAKVARVKISGVGFGLSLEKKFRFGIRLEAQFFEIIRIASTSGAENITTANSTVTLYECKRHSKKILKLFFQHWTSSKIHFLCIAGAGSLFRSCECGSGLNSDPKINDSVQPLITECACCATRAKGCSFKCSVDNIFKAQF